MWIADSTRLAWRPICPTKFVNREKDQTRLAAYHPLSMLWKSAGTGSSSRCRPLLNCHFLGVIGRRCTCRNRAEQVIGLCGKSKECRPKLRVHECPA